MEQNKTLLIIVSVTLFLAALSGVGLWLFYPRGKPAETGAVAAKDESPHFDPIEWVRKKEEFPQLQPKAEEKKEEVVILYGEKPEKKPEPQAAAPSHPAPAEPPKQETYKRPVPEVTPKPAPSAGVTAAPKTAPKTAPTTQKKVSPTEKPKTVTVKEYVIQVGSFTSLDKAEEAGKLLKSKGLSGQIVVREMEGNRYYRLRIGPYENKEEAEKFLNWVKEIKGFEGSMIFEGKGTRTVHN